MGSEGDVRAGFFWWFVFAAAFCGAAGFVGYAVVRSKAIVFPWKPFLLWCAGGVLAVFVATFLVRYFLRRAEERRELEAPKELVDVVDADKAFLEEFVKNTGVPHAILPWENNRLVLRDESHVRIRNARPLFSGDGAFRLFECVSLVGSMRGVNLFCVRLDRGVDHIRRNWNWRPILNKPLNLYNPNDLVRYPLSTPESENAYLQLRGLQMLEDGFSPEDVRASIDPFRVSDRPRPQRTVVRVVDRGGNDESFGHGEDGEVDEDEVAESLEGDIDEYRRQNKD